MHVAFLAAPVLLANFIKLVPLGHAVPGVRLAAAPFAVPRVRREHRIKAVDEARAGLIGKVRARPTKANKRHEHKNRDHDKDPTGMSDNLCFHTQCCKK